MKGKTIRVRIADLKRHRVRTKKRSPEELEALARSYLETPYHPILCSPDMIVGDGNGRLDGLLLLGETEVDVFVLEEAQDEKSLIKMGFVTAYFREGLSQYEQALAIKSFKEAEPDAPNKDVAKDFKVDPAKVTRATSLFSCIPEVIEAAKAGQIGESDWYAISKLPSAAQPGLLALKLSGASRDVLERQGRKQRAASAPAVRASKIKCPLVSGPVVTVAGDEISLDDAIEALKEATKAMQKARDTGLDASTAQRVWSDMAKAGA